jgi:hypothetical protein
MGAAFMPKNNMSGVPAKLYKYIPPERAVNVLGELLIRFSQASVMNDIEEFKPPISGMADEPLLQQKVLEGTNEKFPGFMELLEKKKGAEGKAELYAKIASPENLARTIKTIYEMNDKNFGILSLSELATSVCMWDKYTEHGRGFLVEFDSTHSWFDQRIADDDDLRHLWRISYVADRAAAFLLALTAQDYLYTKETKWEYEKEWRIMLNFNSAARKAGKDATGTDVLLFAIPPSCIRNVTVGYNASAEFIEQVRSLLAANPSLSHVRLNAARQWGGGSVEIEGLDETRMPSR